MESHEERPSEFAVTPRRVVTGLRATGRVHVGNHWGAVLPFVDLLKQPKTVGYFCIADLHALTTMKDPEALRTTVPALVLDLLAAGVDPERTVLFVQSSVPETSELAWLLASLTYLGELERVPSFKERERQRETGDPINAGMLNYPLLMAADILGVRAHHVSVGEDQYPHLELARDVARRFNRSFVAAGSSVGFFPEPEPAAPEPVRIPGLDGSGKMGKSQKNTIGLEDDEATRWAKIAPAATDPDRRTRHDTGTPEHCPIYALHRHVSPSTIVDQISSQCRSAQIDCDDCKRQLNRELETQLRPLQLRRAELAAKPQTIREVLADGAARARVVVRDTRNTVQDQLGIVRYGIEGQR